MNESLPQRIVDRALQRDPQKAQAEWLGEFRSDIAAFIEREIIEALVVPGRRELRAFVR